MRYAIISDIHANFHALQAVHEDVLRQRAADSSVAIQYWFLGDLIGYGSDPISCIRWLKVTSRIGDRWVPGNHDEWLVRPNSVTSDAYESLSRHREILWQEENNRLREWFVSEVDRSLGSPEAEEEPRSMAVETCGDLTVVFTHASVLPSLRRMTYLYAWEKQKLESEFNAFRTTLPDESGTKLLLCGHTHFPMWVREDENGRPRLHSISYGRPLPLGEGRIILNPGSVGQPRDGDARAAYAILDTREKTVEFRRVRYDVVQAVADLRNLHYPSSLADRLLNADGKEHLQQYLEVYRRPRWDLEAIYDNEKEINS